MDDETTLFLHWLIRDKPTGLKETLHDSSGNGKPESTAEISYEAAHC